MPKIENYEIQHINRTNSICVIYESYNINRASSICVGQIHKIIALFNI